MDLILQFSEAEIGYWASVYWGVWKLREREIEKYVLLGLSMRFKSVAR